MGYQMCRTFNSFSLRAELQRCMTQGMVEVTRQHELLFHGDPWCWLIPRHPLPDELTINKMCDDRLKEIDSNV
jgi:hypothetical protein